MKQYRLGLLTLVLGTEMLMAGSAPRMRARCNEDSLDVGPATERIEWAAKCSHITAIERQDSLYEGGTLRTRPLHHLFGKEDFSEIWAAPVDRNAPCSIPGGMSVIAFCTSSCYTPDQELLFPEGFVAIKKAKDEVLPHVMALRDTSTLSNLHFLAMPVESYTEEVRPNRQDLKRFKMKSGGELQVTLNHPIVDENGVVKTADQFKVGESLIHYLNGLDPIIAIENLSYFGKVYNLAPETRLATSNVVVAQGYLNGSSFFQNEGVNLQNRKLLRRTIPEGMVHE